MRVGEKSPTASRRDPGSSRRGGDGVEAASEDGQKQEVRKGGGGASPVAKVVKPKVVKDDEGDMSPDYDDDYDGEDNVLGELLGGGDDEYL